MEKSNLGGRMLGAGERNFVAGKPSVEALILGAGMTGLVSANILSSDGRMAVTVADTYGHLGGNHLNEHLVGAEGDRYTFDIGSFIFQDDSPLLDHFPELLDSYHAVTPTWSRLTPQGRVARYPFSFRDDLLSGGPIEFAQVVGSAVRARVKRRAPNNVQEFAEHWLGAHFVRKSGLEFYVERMCGAPAREIDIEFAHSRMMWIADQARMRMLVRRLASVVLSELSRKNHSGVPANHENTQLVRPFQGFEALYSAAGEKLQRQGVEFALGSRFRKLERNPRGFTLHTDSGSISALRVISTIPISAALRLTGMGDQEALPSVRLVSLFFSFAGQRGFDTSILYNFSDTGNWKRLTMHSDFYGKAASGREYFTVESVVPAIDVGIYEAAAAFREHVAINGLFLGDLRLEGGRVTDNAYPIYTRGSGLKALEGVSLLKEFGIESYGRQGAFQYQPTARVSAQEAEMKLEGRYFRDGTQGETQAPT